MKFYKIHGTGNDFICVDNKNNDINLSSENIKFLCNRNFGIGADGVILMEKTKNGDIFMNYWNADGSFAEMCGNGVRVTAHFAKNHWNIKKNNILVDTKSGLKEVSVKENNLYQVNMGKPIFKHRDFPENSIKLFDKNLDFLSMGNPHAVIFFDSEEKLDIFFNQYAKKIESNTAMFPNKINVNGVWQKDNNTFGQKTYERGVGLTLACGTGASASFTWICKKFNNDNLKIRMDILGGQLYFEYSNKKEILMTGEAKRVFIGEIFL